jgi:predicted phosphate transport protein (TIGR00153 family)
LTSPDKLSWYRIWYTKFFSPKTDFYALLRMQSQKTLEGMGALSIWINEKSQAYCDQVIECEHQADQLVLDLDKKLVDSFITPFDREDIYDLSIRLDEVINAAKATVREVEALDISVDDYFAREMLLVLLEGTRCLNQSFIALNRNLNESAQQATFARKAENRASKLYRTAMRALFENDDFKKIEKTKELYKSLMLIAQRLDEVAAKLLHVIVKIR